MELCQNINLKREEEICQEANIFMSGDAWKCSTHYFINEEKECINEDSTILKYTICKKIDFILDQV